MNTLAMDFQIPKLREQIERAGCEQGRHAWRNGYCRHCGAMQRKPRFGTREFFTAHYRAVMRDEAMAYRRALQRYVRTDSPVDKELAAAHLQSAVWWRGLAQRRKQ